MPSLSFLSPTLHATHSIRPPLLTPSPTLVHLTAHRLPRWRDWLLTELAHTRSSSVVVLVALTKIDLAPSAADVLATIERIRAAYPQVGVSAVQ